MHFTSPAHQQGKNRSTTLITCRGYKSIKNYNYKEQIHLMHYTSPAHPQEKKQEYQIDDPQRLVNLSLHITCTSMHIQHMCPYYKVSVVAKNVFGK